MKEYNKKFIQDILFGIVMIGAMGLSLTLAGLFVAMLKHCI